MHRQQPKQKNNKMERYQVERLNPPEEEGEQNLKLVVTIVLASFATILAFAI